MKNQLFCIVFAAIGLFLLSCQGNKKETSTNSDNTTTEEVNNSFSDVMVYCLSEEGKVCLLDLQTKKLTDLQLPESNVEQFSVSPDQKYIVCQTEDALNIYDLNKKESVGTLQKGKNENIEFQHWNGNNMFLYGTNLNNDNADYFFYTINGIGKQGDNVSAMDVYVTGGGNEIVSGDLSTTIMLDNRGRIFYQKGDSGGVVKLNQYVEDFAVSYDGKTVALCSKDMDADDNAEFFMSIYKLNEDSTAVIYENPDLRGYHIQFNPFDDNLITFADPAKEAQSAEDLKRVTLLNIKTKETKALPNININWIDADRFITTAEDGLHIYHTGTDEITPFLEGIYSVQVFR